MILDPDKLNAECACVSLDRGALSRHLNTLTGDIGFAERLAATHPTLLSNLPVFLKPDHIARMAGIIREIETVARLPAYQEAALSAAPAIARFETGAIGVLMGYDFHLGKDGPKLIEINTNAGGALINAVLAEAQKACCVPASPMLSGLADAEDVEAAILQSFLAEWRNERGTAPLKTVAIVDEAPQTQYLYPEFVLFQRLFQRHGIEAIIIAPERLTHSGERLHADTRPIDLVYNRMTDFSLVQPGSAALRSAYLERHVVLTPNPQAHAIFADKRNLVRLTDGDLLRRWGVPADTAALLASGIPKTVEVTKENASTLWAQRSGLFFKPCSGFGSKAAYRGDKITRKVWDTISVGGYIAQDLVPPSTRSVVIDGQRTALKADLRNYTYNGKIQLTAARLYQGQTTNMRTPGGGFAPVLSARYGAAADCCIPGAEGVACL